MNLIQIHNTPFDPLKALADFQAQPLVNQNKAGATASFIGTMRDFNEGDDVTAMVLEHYPKMTERALEAVVKKAEAQWAILHTLVIHRVGEIQPSDSIVLVATWSAHRAAAFDACRFIMEELKSTVPFWKKETLSDGSHRWVEKNTSG